LKQKSQDNLEEENINIKAEESFKIIKDAQQEVKNIKEPAREDNEAINLSFDNNLKDEKEDSTLKSILIFKKNPLKHKSWKSTI